MTDTELVEIVDSAGQVQRVVARSQMRVENLRHRCVYVAVLSQANSPKKNASRAMSAESRLIVHQRSASKDLWPSYWDLAFGGVCSVGESWQRSALRELREETGLHNVELIELGSVQYADAHTDVVGQAYVAICSQKQLEGQLVNVDGEVVAFASLRLGDLPTWLSQTNVCPDSAAVVAPALVALMNN